MAITRTVAKKARGKLATALGLAMVATGVGAVFAAPASAGTNCASGYHCVMYSNLDSAKHSYSNSDPAFTNDTFNERNVTGIGQGQVVNDNVASASNSTNSNRESHYYTNANYGVWLFCVNPGSQVNILPDYRRNKASSLEVLGRTTRICY